MDEYDFIGLVERFDESLVLLRLLLGLDAGDILYLPSKFSGAYTGAKKKGGCMKIPDKIDFPEMKPYLDSPAWKHKNAFTNEIHAAINRSLDLTIDHVGRQKFEEALSEHRHLLELSKKLCGDKAFFPCSREGVIQLEESKKSCYLKDHGCGYACLDDLYQNYTTQKRRFLSMLLLSFIHLALLNLELNNTPQYNFTIVAERMRNESLKLNDASSIINHENITKRILFL